MSDLREALGHVVQHLKGTNVIVGYDDWVPILQAARRWTEFPTDEDVDRMVRAYGQAVPPEDWNITMEDWYRVKAALLAVKERTNDAPRLADH